MIFLVISSQGLPLSLSQKATFSRVELLNSKQALMLCDRYLRQSKTRIGTIFNFLIPFKWKLWFSSCVDDVIYGIKGEMFSDLEKGLMLGLALRDSVTIYTDVQRIDLISRRGWMCNAETLQEWSNMSKHQRKIHLRLWSEIHWQKLWSEYVVLWFS